AGVVARVESGRMLVMLNRNDYWQCAYVIPKGTADEVKQAGLDDFRSTVVDIFPLLRDRLHEIDSWDKVKLLTVEVDRWPGWYRAGSVCIADAAHAMSPIGGVGINLGVQDAVAAANILAEPLRRGAVTIETLKQVQQRREFPTRVTQRLQIIMQNNLIAREQKRAAESTTVHENAAMAALAAHSRASARLWRPPGAHPFAGSVMSAHRPLVLLRTSAPVTHLMAAQRYRVVTRVTAGSPTRMLGHARSAIANA